MATVTHNAAVCQPVLSHTWQPCTSSHNSIHEFLGSRLFPVTFRDLIPQWKARGSPRLLTLRTPWALSVEANGDLLDTLPRITKAQEERIARVIAATPRFSTNKDKHHGDDTLLPFAAFQSHLHIYCSVYAELSAALHDFDGQAFVYDNVQRALVQSFDLDRIKCLALGDHDCLGRIVWGEVYSWPIEKIMERLKGAPLRFSSQAKTFNSLRSSWSPPSPRPLQLHSHSSRAKKLESSVATSASATSSPTKSKLIQLSPIRRFSPYATPTAKSNPSTPTATTYASMQLDRTPTVCRPASVSAISPVFLPSDAQLGDTVSDYFSHPRLSSSTDVSTDSSWSSNSYDSRNRDGIEDHYHQHQHQVRQLQAFADRHWIQKRKERTEVAYATTQNRSRLQLPRDPKHASGAYFW